MRLILIFLCVISYDIVIAQSNANEKLGLLSISMFHDSKEYPWYQIQYDNYSLDTDVLDSILNEFPDISFKLFVGLWCSDSKSFLPKFGAIVDYIEDVSNVDLEIYGINRGKNLPEDIVNLYDIKFVPTLIVLKNGSEINRIEEFVVESAKNGHSIPPWAD
ncbi:thioredoxin family protein [Flagellimonas lutaonensis]|uniref:Thioredoxin n=1 Tax=Flagellimonas lutaonensis TaxID=516051 RepID=A0A0D5YRN2_9FLAO|nr:thioredoxin family protein [Allomuricauda lutaonensis]AKA34559.1 hypothetical protein VC82_909 [Allomuricauda lutaonensis]